MTSAAAGRLRAPDRNRGSFPAFLAALIMHAALIASMWFAVQWRTSASAPASAELWELPPALEETTPLPTPTPAPVPETPAPPPPSEAPAPKPEIAQAQEKPRKIEDVPRKETPPKKDKKTKPSPAQPTAQELKRQQAEADKRHADELKRLTSQAGSPSPTRAVASSGPISNEWGARIRAAVLANLNFAVPEGVSPSAYAEFKVSLLPDGELGDDPQLTKSSGVPGFDEAARRAILRTNPFPRKPDGSVDPSITLQLYPQDVR
jgi:colicin import membrane protein